MTKTVLITGCSSGLGLSMTKALLQAGWQVIATARDLDKSAELRHLAHPALTLLKLDITCPKDKSNLQQYLSHQLNGRLDCLINNAGYGLLGVLEELSDEQIRHQLEVNVFGVIFLTRLCLPFLRKAQGKIINISSLMGYVGFPLQSLYVTSKFALEGLTESLHYELAPQNVQVALIEPGVHGTAFGENAILAPTANATSAYSLQKKNFMRFKETLAQRQNASSESFAKCIVKLLKKPKLPLRTRIGRDANLMYNLKRILPSSAFTKLMHSFYKKIFLQAS